MSLFLRRFALVALGLLLLFAPTYVRDNYWQYNNRTYEPPAVPTLDLAATPVPTATAMPLNETRLLRDDELRAGPVVVDLAHYNFLNPSSVQPLADALADRGLGVRYWLSPIDPMTVMNYLEYPDQSEELAAQLADASALIIVSPFFLWSPAEITLVEQFVADGGRLLLVSDPDIQGDYAPATNMVGEPFGVVFNDDYLYDTTLNDGNFTYFFQESLLVPDAVTPTDGNGANEMGTATAPLGDSTIAFYGGRSLSGDLQPVLQSIDTTRSSLRVGRSGFTTAAIAGLAERGTAGRVLALSDIDVMTEPYRQRHDNQRMVEFVADFLSADSRINRVVDFPDYLGKEVALAFGASDAINADLLIQGAQIQQQLERSGRTLALTDSSALTGTVSVQAARAYSVTDMIYLAAYTTAMSQTTLLPDLGIELYREVVTKTVPVNTPAPAATGTTEAADTDASDDAEDVLERDELEPTDGATFPAPEDPEPPLTTTVPITTTSLFPGLSPEIGMMASAQVTTTTPVTTTDAVTTTDNLTVTDGLTVTDALTVSDGLTVTDSLTTTDSLTITNEITESEAITAAEPPTATTTPTATPPVTSATGLTTTATVTATPALTVTEGITGADNISATPAFEVRTFITTYLRTSAGLTFLADETVLVVNTPFAGDKTLLAVLASTNVGLDAGVARLLSNDFSDCVIGETLTFCALSGGDSSSNSGGGSAGSSATSGESAGSSSSGDGSDDTDDEEPAPGEDDETPSPSASNTILLIDDNSAATPDELSEADIYLQLLLGAGYEVDLWSVGDQGDPSVDDFADYGWVIWSNGGYAAGEIDPFDLDTIFTYISDTGRLTISSRMPLPGLETVASLQDLVVEGGVETMTDGLPSTPIELTEADATSAVLNALAEDEPATDIVLRRGPASENADAPALVVLADPGSSESQARLVIAAFSMAWLPETEQATLIENMADYMVGK